jgi:hypothetical protein
METNFKTTKFLTEILCDHCENLDVCDPEGNCITYNLVNDSKEPRDIS